MWGCIHQSFCLCSSDHHPETSTHRLCIFSSYHQCQVCLAQPGPTTFAHNTFHTILHSDPATISQCASPLPQAATTLRPLNMLTRPVPGSMRFVKRAATPSGAEGLDVELLNAFQLGCFRGGQMSADGFFKMCEYSGVERDAVSRYTSEMVFSQNKLRGAKSINYHQFRQCVRQLAPKRFPDDDSAWPLLGVSTMCSSMQLTGARPRLLPAVAYAKTRALFVRYDPTTPVEDEEATPVEHESKKERDMTDIDEQLNASQAMEESARLAFAKYDVNTNNRIDRDELETLLQDAGFSEKDIAVELSSAVDDEGMAFDTFVQYFNRLQTRAAHREASKEAEEDAMAPVQSKFCPAGYVSRAPSKVHEAFGRFCRFGVSRSDAHTLDSCQFSKLCRDCHLVGRHLKAADIDVIFRSVKPAKSRVLPFPEFEQALDIIAQRLYPKSTLEESRTLVFELIMGTMAPIPSTARTWRRPSTASSTLSRASSPAASRRGSRGSSY